ncbi:mth938 domain-containing protein-like isoform X1 [Lethenteron reissneri]|uniref:mth938 domain-containing protein-like isoform X1 n=1 Tax=Lethenteron reissneri TaxID=7753 RepID=UPI002AB6E273|nr:mth938 domain-containing protein-like isoform X1 [Lethenteron reissneri]XP_061437890.1 mth938 domain-containing protein-like isoform X1 [Lethenteron reissneri]
MASPRVEALRWGELRVCGASCVYKDCKVWPGGSRAWDWRETGTDHRPGVQPADLQEVLDAGIETLVIGCGMNQALQVPRATQDFVRARGVTLLVLPTERAVDEYNRLIVGGATATGGHGGGSPRVGGVFHSTC